ncbi:MAG: decaprenyl-phosphate phosphoribosyltransferase [Anaerolineaceae bacterium]|jgi:4-hydroxybenzoate polyprenyltransferase
MLLDILKTMRPRQWPKNAFVLAALVFDRQLAHLPALFKSLEGLFIFCLISSTVYIINDIADVEADRQHPTKRNRPIASGKLSVKFAIIATVIILLICFPIAFFLSDEFALVVLVYFLINLAYSTLLKHVPLIDVLIIAAGFVLRVAAGVSLIHVERFSPWLYVVTTLFALYVGFGKRRAELALLTDGANAHRRVLEGYSLPFLDQLITIVSSTTIIAYSLYTFSAPNLPTNHVMMLTIPFVLYGVFRYLYLIQIKNEGGAPEELLLTDRPLQLTIGLWGIAVLLVFYIQWPS